VVSILALLFTFAPLLSGAANAASRQADTPITGTLVATPQNTLPSMLFLQVGSQTILVNVTASTDIERRYGGHATLSDLQDGNQLEVFGSPNAQGGIDATLIRDLSLGPVPPQGTLKVTGMLGVTPSQITLPATLCVQNAQVSSNVLTPNVATVSPCPAGQLPILVTTDTKLYRADYTRANLYELRAGDALTITGSYSDATFTAAWLQDGSLYQTYTQFTGTVQSVAQDSAVSAITDVTALVTALGSPNAPFAVGAQFVLPITDSSNPSCQSPSAAQPPCTRVVINGAASNGYAGTGIDVSDTASAWGVYNNQLKQFEYVKSLRVTASTVHVQGNLAAPVQAAAAPATDLLCLSNVSVTNAAPHAQVATVSPCANGWLPVYVTATTRYLRKDGTWYTLDKLMVGDQLAVTGYFTAGQFTALVVRDLSRHAIYTTIIGQVQYVSFGSTPTYFTMVVQRVKGNQASLLAGQAITVDTSASTRIKTPSLSTNAVTSLNPGETVSVTGYYDSSTRTVSPTLLVTVL
jgi:hypothetical protein